MNPTLFTFDTSSHMHRVYRSMQSKNEHLSPNAFTNGYPTYFIKPFFNLVFSEMRFFQKNFNIKPDYFAFVFDGCSDNNFRKKLYPEYKANRDDTPEEFMFQKRIIYALLNALGFKTLSHTEYEADDIIATLATKLNNRNINHFIFTKDKDLFALVNDNTHIYNGNKTEIYTPDKVLKEKGVPPSKIQDYLTLLGDKVDNIKGLNGCGA